MKAFIINTTIKASAVLGLTGAFVLYFILETEAQSSSPLALLLMAAMGLLIVKRQELIGNLLLTLAGAALLVHPFMYATSIGYLLGGLPLVIAGAVGLFWWWNV